MVIYLFNRHELGRVSSTNTRFTVSYSFISHRELAEVVADHFGFDFNEVEASSSVDVYH